MSLLSSSVLCGYKYVASSAFISINLTNLVVCINLSIQTVVSVILEQLLQNFKRHIVIKCSSCYSVFQVFIVINFRNLFRGSSRRRRVVAAITNLQIEITLTKANYKGFRAILGGAACHFQI